MEAFTFAVSTQLDFPIHVKMYALGPSGWSYPSEAASSLRMPTNGL